MAIKNSPNRKKLRALIVSPLLNNLIQRVFFMRYNYEFKRKCVEMYRQGIVPNIPKGISRTRFIQYLNDQIHLEVIHGSDGLKQKNQNISQSLEEKLVLVSIVIAGKSIKSVTINDSINNGMYLCSIFHRWGNVIYHQCQT